MTIELPYGEQYSDLIRPHYAFELTIGGKAVGRGTVEKIVDSDSELVAKKFLPRIER